MPSSKAGRKFLDERQTALSVCIQRLRDMLLKDYKLRPEEFAIMVHEDFNLQLFIHPDKYAIVKSDTLRCWVLNEGKFRCEVTVCKIAPESLRILNPVKTPPEPQTTRWELMSLMNVSFKSLQTFADEGWEPWGVIDSENGSTFYLKRPKK